MQTLKPALFRLVFALTFVVSATSRGQDTATEPGATDTPAGIQLFDQFGPSGIDGLDSTQEKLKVSAGFKVEKDGRAGVLEVTADIALGWHTYSMDQAGPLGASKITVKSVQGAKLAGTFLPDHQPSMRRVQYYKVPLIEYHGQVRWSAPIQLEPGVKAEDVKFDLAFDGQVCHDEKGCIPFDNLKVPVEFLGYEDVVQASGSPPSEGMHATIQGWAEPLSAEAGQRVQLKFHASVEPKWHIYAYEATQQRSYYGPTLFVVDKMPEGWVASTPVASSNPKTKTLLENEPPIPFHEDEVTWTIDLTIPAETPEGKYEISGLIGYQTCEEAQCDKPTAARFVVTVPVGAEAAAGRIPLKFSAVDGGYDAVKSNPALATWLPAGAERSIPELPEEETAEPRAEGGFSIDDIEVEEAELLPWYVILPMALLGGLILNVMPCVLPVIGLKLMSFVQQAGSNRGRVLLLNVSYSLGTISVFLVLATLAITVGLGWGEQMSDVRFSMVLLGVVFVFSLSLLGVWEMRVPSFFGSGKAGEMAQKEGLVGAFSKGALATVLATPCTAPFLASGLTWATRVSPPLTFMVFLMAGIGMSLPYLLVGLFPSLIAFLPKPGAWMDTFKSAMGFVMLATGVFVFSFIPLDYRLPALACLLGLGVACWWIGKLPYGAGLDKRVSVWLQALTFAGVVVFFSLTWLHGYSERQVQGKITAQVAEIIESQGGGLATRVEEKDDSSLDWRPYSRELLERSSAEGKTVLIDFTAEWCWTCNLNKAVAMNVSETKALVEENGVVVLKADKTEPAPEVDELLVRLGNKAKQIPYVAVFPGSNPTKPILLGGRLFTSPEPILDALKKAGPSKPVSGAAETAMIPRPGGGATTE